MSDRAALYAAATRIIQRIQEYPKASMRDTRRDWLAPPALTQFRRLEPLGFGLEDRVSKWWAFDPRDITPDLVWPLDVGLVLDSAEFKGTNTLKLSDGSELEVETEENDITLSRFYTITMKQARGYATRFSPFMLRADHAIALRGEMLTGAELRAWLGGIWADARPDNVALSFTEKYLKIPLAIILALWQRYEWAVALSFDSSPSVRFATDPTGMKEVFKVRDLPEGRDRRAALLTWVNDHWRQQRHDPDVEVYVRKHLRGTTAFGWRGMQAELLPAQFDIEQRDKLIAEREAMRIAGVDRRSTTRTSA